MPPYGHGISPDRNTEELANSRVGGKCFQKKQHLGRPEKGGKPDVLMKWSSTWVPGRA